MLVIKKVDLFSLSLLLLYVHISNFAVWFHQKQYTPSFHNAFTISSLILVIIVLISHWLHLLVFDTYPLQLELQWRWLAWLLTVYMLQLGKIPQVEELHFCVPTPSSLVKRYNLTSHFWDTIYYIPSTCVSKIQSSVLTFYTFAPMCILP